ncbi:TnsD family Tn7-like transposition protein [Mitsuaria sp. BK037]|uniref:TnsD family Tn7-like transposition protein n=1 Tax=Mitsuaria sp. BK037 TaxID=2587122 RepID=UPI00161921F1|nr:TnsD family Tn7-like transposition protein [Mitsuaria sp. BK037]MBB3283194.1 hypothetical protein [Mitsuaria sp. BK037]
MLACLVSPLPDELICSWVARIIALNALGDARASMAVVLGQRHARISVDLPGRLGTLAQRLLPGHSTLGAGGLLELHTLFPHFRTFLPASRWPALRDTAISGVNAMLKARLGVLAHGVGASPPWRSCAACDAASMATWNVAYWHRCHHLPGVHVCARHGTPLTEWLRQARQGHAARLPLPGNFMAALAPALAHSQSHYHLAKLSEQTMRWTGPSFAPAIARRVYVAELTRRGWTRRGGAPACEPLIEALLEAFATLPELAPGGRLAVRSDGRMPWVQGLLVRRERFHAPLCHLLVMSVLFGSWQRLTRRWAQADDALALADASASSALEVSSVSQPTQRPITATCATTDAPRAEIPSAALDLVLSCRTAAVCCHWSVHAIVAHRRAAGLPVSARPRRALQSAKAELLELLAQGIPVAQAARRSRVSASTAYRALAERPALQCAREAAGRHLALQRYRRTWLSLTRTHPDWGPKRTRQAAQATYAWLYRNDRDWLQAHKPSGTTAQHRPARVDWSQRDADLAAALERSIRTLDAGAAVKLTVTQLVGLVLPHSSARRHAAKLPLLMACAARHARRG